MADDKIRLLVQSEAKNALKDLEQFENKVKDTAKKSGNSFKRMAEKLKSNFIAVAATLTGLAVGVMKSVGAASKLEEATAKFKTVFRGVVKEATAMRDVLVSSYAMSTREATEFLSSTQDLFVPLGVARDKAAKLSNEVVKLAADLGSFNNMPTARVMQDIQSALVGNFETMKKYGVILNETTLKQMALSRGIELTNGMIPAQEKALLALEKIQTDSGDAIGDLARTQDSYANSVKAISASVEDAMAKVGESFIPVLKGLINFLNPIIDGLKKMPAPIRTAILAVGTLTVAFVALNAALGPIGLAITALSVATVAVGGLITKTLIDGAKKAQTEAEYLAEEYGKFADEVKRLKDLTKDGKIKILQGDTKKQIEEAQIALDGYKEKIKNLKKELQSGTKPGIVAGFPEMLTGKDIKQRKNTIKEYEKFIEETEKRITALKEKEGNKRTGKTKEETDAEKRERKKFFDEYEGLYLTAQEKEIKAVERKYAQMKEMAEKYGKDVAIIEEKLNEEIDKINKKYAKNEKSYLDQILDNWETYADGILNIINGISGLILTDEENKLQEKLRILEEEKQAELEAVMYEVDIRNMANEELEAIRQIELEEKRTALMQEIEDARKAGDIALKDEKERELKKLELQEQAAKRRDEIAKAEKKRNKKIADEKIKIEAEYDEKAKELERAHFEREKGANFASAVSAAILAGVKALYVPPVPNFPLAAITSGAGMIEAARINMQEFPAYAMGGIVDSPTLAQVGEGGQSEAIVPLPDGRTIPVSIQDGGNFGSSFDGAVFNVYPQDFESFVDNLQRFENENGLISVG